jgi:hypothetical protein
MEWLLRIVHMFLSNQKSSDDLMYKTINLRLLSSQVRQSLRQQAKKLLIIALMKNI